MENIKITLHEGNIGTFNSKLAELNEKFSKKGLPLISCSMESFIYKATDAITGEIYPVTMYDVILSSDFNQANISGVECEFEGVVSLVEKNENDKIYNFKNINYSNLLKDCKCDKCGKKIGRNKYIVFSKSGKEVESRDDLIVLGTSCAKEYFPFDAERYFNMLGSSFSILGDFDEFTGSFGCSSHYHTFYAIYMATCAVTNNFKVYEKDGVTKSNVFGWMNNDKFDKYSTYHEIYPMPQNSIPYENVISWVKDMYDTDEFVSDFHTNARSVFFKTLDDGTREMRHEIHEKYMGIAVYAMFAAKQNHDKMLAKKVAEEKRIAENADVTYFGNVGDKFEKEMTFEKMFGFETQFGYQYILLFRDEENHVFKWSTSNGSYKTVRYGREGCVDYEVGKKYIIKGSIKAHNEYKGVKQTVVTRCKVVNDFYVESEETSDVESEDPFELLNSTMSIIA